MKNKKFIAKSFLTLAMSVSMIAAGATLAVNKTAKAADGVTVSQDIQKIINDINANGSAQGFTAKYVENADVANAEGKVSGIRITFTSDIDSQRVISAPFDSNGLTYEDKVIGMVFDTDSGNGTLYAGLGDLEDTAFFTILSKVEDNEATNPRSGLQLRYYSPSSSYQFKYGANIHPYNKDSGVGGGMGVVTASRGAYTSTPFNYYYDNGKNMLLADKKYDANDKVLLLYNVSPSDYSKYNDPITGNPLTNSSKTVDKIDGFEHNRMRFVMRTHNANNKSLILTSFAGLDLTDPNAAYTADKAPIQLVDYNAQTETVKVMAGVSAAVPAAHLASRITNAKVADFTGTVKIYNKKRSSVSAEYGSYGYAYATADDELGAPVSTVNAGEEYTFANIGDYTLEYVQGDKKLYVDVNAIENTPKAVALTAANASVDKQEVTVGEQITVTPNEGCTLYGFGESSPRVRITVGKTFKYVDLVDGKFTVTSDMFDGDELKLSVAAYSSKVNLTVFTKPFDEGNDSVHYTLYEGVPSTYYDGANNDGSVNVSGFKFTYGLVGDAWKMNLVSELGNFGYVVEINDGETVSKHVYKTGVAASNAFAVKGSVLITPIRLSVTAVENSAVAYLKGGNVNVSMEYKVPAVQWDNFIGAVGDGAGQIDVKGVFDKGEKPTGRPFNYANGVTFKVDLQKVTEREIAGKNYYIIRLECANLKIENVNKKYYFGISLLFNCENGGQVLVNDPSGAFLWTEVDMKTEVEKLYAKYIKTTAPEDHHTTVTVNGTEYYSYISKASTTKLVEYHLMAA